MIAVLSPAETDGSDTSEQSLAAERFFRASLLSDSCMEISPILLIIVALLVRSENSYVGATCCWAAAAAAKAAAAASPAAAAASPAAAAASPVAEAACSLFLELSLFIPHIKIVTHG